MLNSLRPVRHESVALNVVCLLKLSDILFWCGPYTKKTCVECVCTLPTLKINASVFRLFAFLCDDILYEMIFCLFACRPTTYF